MLCEITEYISDWGYLLNRTDDGDWSTERSCVCLWNLEQRGLQSNQPNLIIDAPSAVTALCCHPNHPALIAGILKKTF